MHRLEVDNLNPIRPWADLPLTDAFIMSSLPLVHHAFGIFLKRSQLKSWGDYKSLTSLTISELHFFLFCSARLWNSWLCPPAAFCLVFYCPTLCNSNTQYASQGKIGRVSGSIPCISNLIRILAPSHSWLLWHP